MNKPYVKQFDKNGELLNPIKKGRPYLSEFPNKEARSRKTKKKNNKIPVNSRGVNTRRVVQQQLNEGRFNPKPINRFTYHINQ
jgi:hypothetical protein